MRRHSMLRYLTSALTLALVACGDDAVSPTAGTIQITVETVGEAGVEAYELALDGGDPRPVAPGGTLRFADIDPGDYELRLGLLPTHCIASGANPRTVSLAAGQTAVVEFRVVCDATGSVLVITRTTGESRDTDGYVLALSAEQRSVGIEAETRIERVEAGTRMVTLFGVASNCTVADGTTREITVAVGAETSVTFEVTCEFIGAVRWDTIPLPFRAQSWLESRVIWGSSPSDIFVLGEVSDAVGLRQVIMHYDGRQWTEQASFIDTGLFGIAGTTPTDVFVVGITYFTDRRDRSFILHYDGALWSEIQGADTVGIDYRGVWQAPGGEAFVSGGVYRDDVRQELLARYDGVSWTDIGMPGFGLGALMLGVTGTSSTDVWSIGGHRLCEPCSEVVALITHWNGAAWTIVGRYPGAWFSAITAVAPDDVWIAGSPPDSSWALLHWNGAVWTTVSPTEERLPVVDVWGSSKEDVYAVGSRGLLHYNGATWTKVPGIRGTQVWGSSRDDVFVLDENRLLHGKL